jgi:hypothetical protein
MGTVAQNLGDIVFYQTVPLLLQAGNIGGAKSYPKIPIFNLTTGARSLNFIVLSFKAGT